MSETTAAEQAMSIELGEAIAFLKEHQKKQGIFHPCDTLKDRIRSVMREYEDTAANALAQAKRFRDRIIIDLRAFSLVVSMAGNASTHREKDARLRGCVEMLESAIDRLERNEFDLACCSRPSFLDPFKSDFPTRHFVDRIHELEAELAEMKKAQEEKAP